MNVNRLTPGSVVSWVVLAAMLLAGIGLIIDWLDSYYYGDSWAKMMYGGVLAVITVVLGESLVKGTAQAMPDDRALACAAPDSNFAHVNQTNAC